MKFKIGDSVTWTSQASGFTKEKTGVIVKVLQPDERFRTSVGEMEEKFTWKWGGGISRDHESYLVAVPSKSGRGKRILYWPIVDKLIKI